MPTIVYQGLQSCIDQPHTVETTTLRLKLSSPNPGSDSWNITQSLTNTPPITKSSYIHPMTKNSTYSQLSNISLELCTETLGCETGTNMIDDSYFSLCPVGLNEGEHKEREQLKSHKFLDTSKKSPQNFPPPLTTMSKSNYRQVRTIREGGRLVIEAVEAPSSHGCFQAERSNGRLKLSLFKDSENDETATKNESLENNTEDLQNDINYELEEEGFEEIVEEEFVNGDMEGSSEKAGGGMEIGKFQRPTRCKEGGRCNKGLCTWESFWVASS